MWVAIFRRNLNEVKEAQSRSLLLCIGNVFIPRNGKDRRIWMASAEDMFSVASLFFSLTRYVVVSHTNWTSLWRMKAPLRIIVVGWMTLLGGVLTMSNLRHRWVVVVNACIMCLVGEESIFHLLLDRRSAQCLWRVILGWFQFWGPLPNSILALFKNWRLGVGSKG